MPLDRPITSYVSVPLSYSADTLRFGYDSQEQNLSEQRRNRILIDGANRIFKLQRDFYNGFLTSARISVSQVRDLFVSLALGKINRCMQTRDMTLTQLTAHSERWWSRFTTADVWPNLPAYDDDDPYVPNSGFYSVLGTLAFYLYLNDDPAEGSDAFDLIDKCLGYFWGHINSVVPGSLTYSDAPITRFSAVLDYIGFSAEQAAAMTSWLQTSFDTTFTPASSAPNHHVQLRQNLIVPTDWSLLRRRIFAGEYVSELVGILTELGAENQQGLDYATVESRVLTLAPPCGMSLIYGAFAVEGMVKFAKVLNRAGDPNTFYKDYVNTMSEGDRLEAIQSLALSYDAWARLAQMNLIFEADGLAQRCYVHAAELVAASNLSVFPITDDNRLFL